jgi:23S rRNA (pseudouridine1915-N3)-methyltransferase
LRLAVLAIGKLKSAPERELVKDYGTRISAIGRKSGMTDFSAKEFAESQLPTAGQRLHAEAETLWAHVPQGSVVVALDERGSDISSEAFAKRLGDWANAAKPATVFMIGGPDGHDDTTRQRAGLVLGLGKMTWPHRLVRVLLAEQIYRALTILQNHPYHRS